MDEQEGRGGAVVFLLIGAMVTLALASAYFMWVRI